jgi:hypothetical protein
MQVFGLPGHVIRNGRAASRFLAAQTPNIEAARRRDAVARWRQAMAAGLGAVEAAKAVGVPRATLYRWQAKPEPGSRRPRRTPISSGSKQDRSMADHMGKINAAALLSVGAAFDFSAGAKQNAPAWMQRSGLEWIFRLARGPRRLARRHHRDANWEAIK